MSWAQNYNVFGVPCEELPKEDVLYSLVLGCRSALLVSKENVGHHKSWIASMSGFAWRIQDTASLCPNIFAILKFNDLKCETNFQSKMRQVFDLLQLCTVVSQLKRALLVVPHFRSVTTMDLPHQRPLAIPSLI